MSKEIDGFSSLESKLTAIERLSKSIEKSWGGISANAAKMSKVQVGGTGGGQKGLASGQSLTGSSFGGFSSGHDSFAPTGMPSGGGTGVKGRIGSVIQSGMGKVAEYNQAKLDATEANLGGNIFGLGDIVDLGRNMFNATAQFLPNVNNTMNRATSYYNAGIYGGSQLGRKDLQQVTYGTMAKMNGLTSAGSDANVAQFLAGRGMTASGAQNSTYQQTLRTVSNAARYMNISNEQAAASVEGMTSAQGASQTLRNFGIYTADLKTGKEKTQTQIFEELAQRLTAGRGQASVEQTQQSIRRGALGVTVDAFFQGDAQGGQMFKQYMIERARGKGKSNMDLASGTQTDKAIGSGNNVNPLDAQMTLTNKQTGAMNAAESEYIKGINAATGALSLFTAASGQLVKLLGSGSAMMQTILGNDQTKGLISGVTAVGNYGAKAVGTALTFASMGNFGAAASTGILAGVGLAGVGLAGVAASGVANTFGNSSNVGGINNTGGGRAGEMNGAIIGTGGGTSNAMSGQRFNSGGQVGGGGTTGAPSTAMTPMFSTAYAEAYRVTTVLGSHDSLHTQPGGHHGTDYGMAKGTPVKAVGDGVVSFVKGNITREGNANDGLGNHVIIHHLASNGDKYTSIYAHLSKVMVATGNKVSKGDVVGLVGSTGHSTGAHLHQEINKGWQNNNSGTPVPPAVADKILSSGSTLDGTPISGEAGAAGTPGAAPTAASIAEQQRQFKQFGIGTPSATSTNALSILQNLYSGDVSKVTTALSAMGKGLGMTDGLIEKGVAAGLAGNPDAAPGLSGALNGSPAGVATGTTPGGTTNNNVSIVVQVPDVSSADAIQFGQLVKQYLDSNALVSNTGSI